MNFEEWYETSIGCNSKIDFKDTVENNCTDQRLNCRTYNPKKNVFKKMILRRVTGDETFIW
jgi:hypothetical protein